MNKIFEAIVAHAYLPEFEEAERERLRKLDEEFVRKNIVGVVGTAAEGGPAFNINEYD